MTRRLSLLLCGLCGLCAAMSPAAYATSPGTSAPTLDDAPWRHLSPAGRLLLRVARGEISAEALAGPPIAPRVANRTSPSPAVRTPQALNDTDMTTSEDAALSRAGRNDPTGREGQSGRVGPLIPLRPGAGRPSAGVSLRRINSLERDLEQTRGNPGGPATTQSETNISVFGPNVVVGYNNSATGVTDGSFSGFSFSNDGGRTWADRGGVPREAFTYNIGDPGLAVDRQGRFYYAQILFDYRKNPARGTLGVSRSTDGGRTFSRPVDIYPASPPLDVVGNIGEKIHSLSDKELIAVDNSGGPRDGTVYVAWNQYSETRFPNGSWRVNSQIWLVRSTDGGATWSELVPVSPAQQAAQVNGNVFGTFVSGAVLATGPNGEVYCAWEESRAESVQSIQRIARSDDGGATFALANAPIVTMNNIGNVDLGVLHGGFRINEFPDLAIDRSSGALYLVYSGAPTPWPGDIDAANGADRSDIFLVRSSDRGATWSAPLRVNDDTTESDQFFPAVAVTPDGTVGVMFYDRRHDPYNQRLDVTFARSLDGGRSFRTNERVTATSFPIVQTSPQADPQISDLYMGDYIDMVADATSFHLAWGDNRDVLRTGSYGPRPDPNVYYTRIPSR